MFEYFIGIFVVTFSAYAVYYSMPGDEKRETMTTENKTSQTTETAIAVEPVLATEPCPNCKETVEQCACMRNICKDCGEPVGNITFTICDDC